MKISLLILLSQITFAFNLTPLSQSIVIGKNSETVIYQVENKNKEAMAIEISLADRNMGTDGKEKRPEVKDGKFLLYPTQLILKPGQKRGIKVKWLGGEIKKENAFRIIVEQLPIDFKKDKSSGIKLLLKYLGALYVTKTEFNPSISTKVTSVDGDMVKIQVSNSGTKHQVLKNLKLIFSKDKSSLSFKGKDLKGIDGENILAGKKRNFSFKAIGVNKGMGVKAIYE